MSFFYERDVPRAFGWMESTRILSRLGMPKSELLSLLEEKVNTSPKEVMKLTVAERVYLWMQIPGCRETIKFSDFPPAAKSYIYVRDEKMFGETYDPNKEGLKVNRQILKEIQSRKVFGVFFKKIDDENLSRLMHSHPLILSDALMTYRLHSKAALKKRLIRLFDCSKIRNQSHLRAFIYRYPWLMQNQTLEMMEASTIKRDTWARLIADISVAKRKYFPVGTGDWVLKGIFVKHLKGGRSKKFQDFQTGLPVADKEEEPA